MILEDSVVTWLPAGMFEPLPEVDNCCDLPPEVDDSLDVWRDIGQVGDRRVFHNFLHIEKVDCKVLLAEDKLKDLDAAPPIFVLGFRTCCRFS